MKGYILNGQDASYEYSIIFTITEKKEGFIDNFPIIFHNMSYVHIKQDISDESTQACKALLAGLTAPSLTVAPLSATYRPKIGQVLHGLCELCRNEGGSLAMVTGFTGQSALNCERSQVQTLDWICFLNMPTKPCRFFWAKI